MTEKEEEKYQSSIICWIYEKLIEYEKVRVHCHITGKYRGAAHWSCNLNLKLTKTVFVILHNIKSYDSNLNMNEIGKCNVRS